MAHSFEVFECLLELGIQLDHLAHKEIVELFSAVKGILLQKGLNSLGKVIFDHIDQGDHIGVNIDPLSELLFYSLVIKALLMDLA